MKSHIGKTSSLMFGLIGLALTAVFWYYSVIGFKDIMETTTKSYIAAAFVTCVLFCSAFALGRQIGQGQGRSVWSWLLGVVPVLVILLVAWLRASYFQAEGLSELKGAAAFDANFLSIALLGSAAFILIAFYSYSVERSRISVQDEDVLGK